MAVKYPAAKILYPWRKWAEQKEGVTLKHGKDFNVAIRVMRIGALSWAARHGLKCETVLVDETTLKVRFYDAPARKRNAKPVTKRSKASAKSGGNVQRPSKRKRESASKPDKQRKQTSGDKAGKAKS